jgi:hypothetical protein
MIAHKKVLISPNVMQYQNAECPKKYLGIGESLKLNTL